MEALCPGIKRPVMKLTTQLQLVPRSRKRGSIHPLPHTPSWCSAWLVKARENFTVALFVCVDWNNHQQTSFRVASDPVQTRNKYAPNSVVRCYHHANLLSRGPCVRRISHHAFWFLVSYLRLCRAFCVLGRSDCRPLTECIGWACRPAGHVSYVIHLNSLSLSLSL
jgi:hypothetical protein